MKKAQLLILVLLFDCLLIRAQDADNYKPLRSSGHLPVTFIQPIDQQVK